MSARAALEPLLALFRHRGRGRAGGRIFRARGVRAVTSSRDDLVPDRSGAEIALTRAQETELPRQITIGFADAERNTSARPPASRRLETASRREEATETTAVLRRAEAAAAVDIALQDAWVARETARIDAAARPARV
jgi:hypothetical protein